MRSAALATLLISATAAAQLQVPVAIELTGAEPADRQVTGLADPLSSDAGVSLDAARASATTFATASGTDPLIAALTPAPTGYTAGMSIVIVPQQANAAGASLDLNGLGAVPMVKLGGLPLDSADLTVGLPHRLVYDGQRFQLITSAYRPCPAGYRIGAREYCIADSSREALTFIQANAFCADAGARLCTFAEWIQACVSEPSFLGTVLDFEWVDHAANHIGNAKRVGKGSDGQTGDDMGIGCMNGSHADPNTPTRFRCCVSR